MKLIHFGCAGFFRGCGIHGKDMDTTMVMQNTIIEIGYRMCCPLPFFFCYCIQHAIETRPRSSSHISFLAWRGVQVSVECGLLLGRGLVVGREARLSLFRQNDHSAPCAQRAGSTVLALGLSYPSAERRFV